VVAEEALGDEHGIITALVRGPVPESLVDIACLVLPGRRCEKFVRGPYAKVLLGRRIGGGFIGCRASRVTASCRDLDRLERQCFAEEWIDVHQLDDASAMPIDLRERALVYKCAVGIRNGAFSTQRASVWAMAGLGPMSADRLFWPPSDADVRIGWCAQRRGC
jgi:hypothetical protein